MAETNCKYHFVSDPMPYKKHTSQNHDGKVTPLKRRQKLEKINLVYARRSNQKYLTNNYHLTGATLPCKTEQNS